MQKVCAQLKTFGSASTRCFYTSQFTFPIMVFLFHALLSHGFWEVSMNCVGILILDLKTGRAWQFYSYLSSLTFSLLVYMHVSFTCFPLTIYVHFCNLRYINLPVNKELSVMFILDFPCCFILLLTFLIASWAQALNGLSHVRFEVISIIPVCGWGFYNCQWPLKISSCVLL